MDKTLLANTRNLLRVLYHIRVEIDNNLNDNKYGLCFHIERATAHIFSDLHLRHVTCQVAYALMRTWPEATHIRSLPVPCPEGRRSAAAAYDDAWAKRDMYRGDYGRLRKDLLDHMIDLLEDELLDYGVKLPAERMHSWY
jgi:hypothetical protein